MKPYYAFGRFISPFMVRLWGWHGRLRRVARSRVVVKNKQGEVLLVKSWVGTQAWELPGGAPRRGETPSETAQRELKEEVGIHLPLASFRHRTTLYGGYEAAIFSVTTEKTPAVNRLEIVEAQWVSPEKLPPDASALTRLALQKLSKKR